MAEFPAFPLFTDAYLGDTTHLSTIEHGAYLLLLMVAWRSQDGALPNDDRLLTRYTKLTRAQWLRMKPIIMPFFDVEGGLLIQQRLRDERDMVRQKRESQAANGRASALKRKGRHSTKREPIANQSSTPKPKPTPTVEDISKDMFVEPKVSTAQSGLTVDHVVEAWNQMADRTGLRRVSKITPQRRTKIKTRIRQNSVDEFASALAAVEQSSFLRGENDRGWRADFDWITEPRNFVKLTEGVYDR